MRKKRKQTTPAIRPNSKLNLKTFCFNFYSFICDWPLLKEAKILPRKFLSINGEFFDLETMSFLAKVKVFSLSITQILAFSPTSIFGIANPNKFLGFSLKHFINVSIS